MGLPVRNSPFPEAMRDDAIDLALDKVAELLVKKSARVRLNEVRPVLEDLWKRAYLSGWADADRATEEARDREREQAEIAEFAKSCGLGAW